MITTRYFSISNPTLRDNLITQTNNSLEIEKYVRQEDKVLLFDSDLVTYFFLCDLNPPLERKYGVVYYGLVSNDIYAENIKLADYILLWNESRVKFFSEITIYYDKKDL